jgi:signal transduction histidine kinase
MDHRSTDTERRRGEGEAALLASERALRTLVGTNEALLRARGELELFREVCRVAVEHGGFRMAWAGVPDAGEERLLRPVAWHGVEDGYLAQARITWADEARGRGTAGLAMRTGRVAVANDIATDPRFGPWREAALARGYASNAALPLVYAGERLGIIGAFSEQRGAFSAGVIDVLQRVADDLAFGLAAFRARAASARTATELELATQLIGLEVARLDLRTGMIAMSPRARALRGLAAGGTDLHVDDWLAHLRPEDRGAVAANLARARVATPDAPDLAPTGPRRYRTLDGGARWIEARARVLFDEGGAPVGVISASIDVSVRIEEREQLRALSARLQRVREEEKTRIARDLHDDLGQALTALQLELRAAEALVETLDAGAVAGGISDRLVEASNLASATIATVQRLSQHLRSEALDSVGLDAALRQELRLFARRTGLEVAEALEPVAPLDREVATAGFRIAQEALTNVARHAQATRVDVRLSASAGDLVLEIGDDGRGLAPGEPQQEHLGLVGMRERAREFGGEVQFAARPGGGTRVVARLPRSRGAAR